MSTKRRKRHSPEQIVRKLRDADAMLNAGKDERLAEQEGKREEWRKALEGVAMEAALDMDDQMADCRQAFLEAKANFAGLMAPVQVNRFVAEVVGPKGACRTGGSSTKKSPQPVKLRRPE